MSVCHIEESLPFSPDRDGFIKCSSLIHSLLFVLILNWRKGRSAPAVTHNSDLYSTTQLIQSLATVSQWNNVMKVCVGQWVIGLTCNLFLLFFFILLLLLLTSPLLSLPLLKAQWLVKPLCYISELFSELTCEEVSRLLEISTTFISVSEIMHTHIERDVSNVHVHVSGDWEILS